MAGYADGDAISDLARQLRDLFRAWGHESHIYADPATTSPAMRADSRPLADYTGRADDIVIHHYGIMSPAVDRFLQAPARRIMVYHNITPADWFAGFDDAVAARLTEARERLRHLVTAVDALWTVSQFNARELRAVGAKEVAVLPLPYRAMPPEPPEPEQLALAATPLTNILTVGRIAPNKRLEDLIAAFAWYHRVLNPHSRLIVVGSPLSCPRYYAMLRLLVGDLDLANVCFEGFASAAGLQAYYRLADLYVSTSAHEGYCLPLVEAMDYGVPVLAHATGGTPEAMDGAGVLYEGLDAPRLAALFHRLLSDQPLRREILASQEQRISRAHNRDLASEVRTLLANTQKHLTKAADKT